MKKAPFPCFLFLCLLLGSVLPCTLKGQSAEEKQKQQIRIIEQESPGTTLQERIKVFRNYADSLAGNRYQAHQPVDTLYRLADLLMRHPDLTGNEIFQIQQTLWKAAKNVEDHEKRLAAADLVIRSEKNSAARKNDAVREQTEALMDLQRRDEALKAAESALRTPGLSGQDLYNAYGNLGHVYSMRGKLPDAIAAYRKIQEKDSSPSALLKMNTLMADEYLYFKESEKALRVWRDACKPLKEAECLVKLERFSEAQAVAGRVLENPDAPERDRVEAMRFFMSPEKYFILPDEKAREIRKKYPDLCRKLDTGFLFWRQLRPAMKSGAWAYALEISDLLLQHPVYRENVTVRCMRLNSLLALGRVEEAKKLAEQSLEECPKLTPPEKLRFRLISEALEAGFSPEKLKDGLERASAEAASAGKENGHKLTAEQIAPELVSLGQMLTAGGLDHLADEAFRLYKSLFVPRPDNVYRVPYSPVPLHGYADWVHLKQKAEPGLLKWKYGGGMDFLTTDVSTGNRGTGIGSENSSPASMKYTELYIVCDENGIHFILRSHDDRAAEIQAGTLSGGAYEIYLAPGENEPEHCYLPSIGAEMDGSLWYTTYPNEKSRRISSIQKREQILHPDGFTHYFFIAWDSFYDKIPETEDQFWKADFVHWSRWGGYSWNALESIHSRSTWGKLSFQIPPEGLRKIRIRQIAKALRNYQKSKELDMNGALVLWQDPVLGDPEFYEKELRKYEETLDSYVKMADFAGDMKNETVEFLWSKAVPEWNEIQYRIAEKRRRWLEDKLFAEEEKTEK